MESNVESTGVQSSTLLSLTQAVSRYINLANVLGVTKFYMNSENMCTLVTSKPRLCYYWFMSLAMIGSNTASFTTTLYNLATGKLQITRGADVVPVVIGLWLLLTTCAQIKSMVASREIVCMFNCYINLLASFESNQNCLNF